MTRVQATPVQRFIAYVIDFALITLVFSIILRFVFKDFALPGFTEEDLASMPTSLSALYDGDPQKFLVTIYSNQEQYTLFMNWLIQSGNDYLNTLMQAYFSVVGTVFGVYGLLLLIYLCILPCVWKHQTIGRLFMKVRVVSKVEDKLPFGATLLREIITRIVEIVFAFCLLLPTILSIVFVFTKNETLGDIIGNTQLIRVDEEANKIIESFEEKKNESRPSYDNFDEVNKGEVIDVNDDDIEIVVEVPDDK